MKRLIIIMAIPLAFAVGVMGGCGDVRVDLPDRTFDFSLDANLLRLALEAELGVSLAGLTEIPAEFNLNETFELELPPEQVDLSDEEKLKKYIAAGKVKGVTVKYVKYNIPQNSLNFDLPALELWMDGYDATEISATSSKIAVTKSITKEFTVEEDEVNFTEGGRDVLSDYLMQLKFAMLGMVEITIDTSKSRSIPAGTLQGQLKVGLYFTVDPL